MVNGIDTTNVEAVTLSDDVMVNKDGSTARQKTTDLATQLAGSGALAEQITPLKDRASALETTASDQGSRLTAVEGEISAEFPPLKSRATALEATSSGQEARLSVLENGSYADAIPYATSAAGIADTVEGQRFKVDNADPDVAYDVYLHDAGDVATFVESQPSVAALAVKADQADMQEAQLNLAKTITRTTGVENSKEQVLASDALLDDIVSAVGDDNGNIAQALTASGLTILNALRVHAQIETQNGVVVQGAVLGAYETDWSFAVVDTDGNVGFGIKDGQVYFPETGELADGGISALDARNKAFSEQIKYRTLPVQLPTAVYNVLMNYGQSLGEGNETWPALSKIPQEGALMIGDNADNQGITTYNAMGVDQFNPLVAHTAVSGVNIDGDAEALLAPGDQSKGEPPIIGCANGLKKFLNDRAFSVNDGRNIVAMSSAQGGKTIEQLSKGNTQDATDRYGGMISGITLAKTLADTDTMVVPLLTWLQGESDYAETGYSTSTNKTYALYKGKLETLFDDANVDILAESGQTKFPLKATYQTGANYSFDADQDGVAGLHIGMAQLDVALEREDTIMVGPAYPHSDKGGHWDSNGARWFGHQMAKVVRKVWSGEGWEPLRPIEFTVSGKIIYAHFHVPVPPLRFNEPYVVLTAKDYTDKGFRVTSADGSTAYDILSVEIVADTIVKVTCDEAIPSDALIWYADKTTHLGNGNLCDSDPTVAIENYEYVPERGMYSGANIPALVDRPYPLENWCVAFCYTNTFTEFN